ncbi:MAG: nucleotidyltransferase family protein [Thermoanaerobaculia bacterium]
MKVFLLAAGRGLRLRPVTDRIPKPLLPYLNVPLARAHLQRLWKAGVTEAGVNLHHLGIEIEQHLSQGAADLPKLTFFPEPEILGTAGALKNAASFLEDGDFFVVVSDAAIEPDFASLAAAHRETGHAATLLVVENREPRRYTPLQAEGDRITAFGLDTPRPLLYTGVCVLAPRLLDRIPKGHTALVADLWKPLLSEGRERIGFVLHEGPFSDLGCPNDFLRASLEALERGGPFPKGAGAFDEAARVLSLEPTGGFEARQSVLGRILAGSGARIERSAVFTGTSIGPRARVSGCLVAGGRVAPDAAHENVLLWPDTEGLAAPHPLT